MALRRAAFDHDATALDVTELLKAVSERLEGESRARSEIPYARHRRAALLCIGGERRDEDGPDRERDPEAHGAQSSAKSPPVTSALRFWTLGTVASGVQPVPFILPMLCERLSEASRIPDPRVSRGGRVDS
jgi:hypothetical protein